MTLRHRKLQDADFRLLRQPHIAEDIRLVRAETRRPQFHTQRAMSSAADTAALERAVDERVFRLDGRQMLRASTKAVERQP